MPGAELSRLQCVLTLFRWPPSLPSRSPPHSGDPVTPALCPSQGGWVPSHTLLEPPLLEFGPFTLAVKNAVA